MEINRDSYLDQLIERKHNGLATGYPRTSYGLTTDLKRTGHGLG